MAIINSRSTLDLPPTPESRPCGGGCGWGEVGSRGKRWGDYLLNILILLFTMMCFRVPKLPRSPNLRNWHSSRLEGCCGGREAKRLRHPHSVQSAAGARGRGGAGAQQPTQ